MESKIVIGLPVYNAEKTIRKTLNSILSQTFKDFTLLISDNFSTDSTNLICKEFEKNDKRIQYVLQKKNIGILDNFLYLLNHADSKYFVWIASDDFWKPTFLEKNISILDSNSNVVGSSSKVGIIGDYYHKFDIKKNDNLFKKLYKKLRQHYLSLDFYSICGISVNQRINLCFRSFRYALFLYGVFRTDILKKSVIFETTYPWDWGLVLIILKYGDLHLINEILTNRSPGGASNSNAIDLFNAKIVKFHHILFPKVIFTKWFLKIFGKKIFFQNIGFFIKLNFSGFTIIFLDSIKYLKSLNFRKDINKEKGLHY